VPEALDAVLFDWGDTLFDFVWDDGLVEAGWEAGLAALERDDVRLPSGDRLTPRRFRQVGHMLGMGTGFERLHYLLEEAWPPGLRGVELSDTFLAGVEAQVSFATNPLYAVLHESIYCQGGASRWAAQRVRAEFPELEPAVRPVAFTGEMIYPWMFAEDSALRPLAEAAELLAAKAPR
jgi:hypothetical protein